MKSQSKCRSKQLKIALKQSIDISGQSSDELVIDITEDKSSIKPEKETKKKEQLEKEDQKIREMRQMLMQMTRTNTTFPPILQFIEIDNSGAKINYDVNLHQCLKKMNSNTNEISSELQDEEIILNHLYQIENSINENIENKIILIKSCQSNIFYLFEKSLRIKQRNSKNFINILQNIKLIYYEVKEYLETQKQQSEFHEDEDEDVSENEQSQQEQQQISFQNHDQIEEKKTFEKMRDFTIKILLQKMNQINIVMPELMLHLRLIFKTKDKGRIILLVPSDIIVKICKLQEIQSFAQELKLPLFSQFVPKSTRSALRNKYPEFSYKTLDTVIDEMLALVQSRWDEYQTDIEKVFAENDFKEFLQQMWKICGKQITMMLQMNSDLKARDNQQNKSNFVSIGAKLFQMKKRLESQQSYKQGPPLNPQFIGEENGKSEQFIYENTHTTFLKLFLWKLSKSNIPYPLMIKLLHFSNLTIMVMNRKQYLKEIVQTKLFIQFIKENYGYEIETLNPMERVESVFFTNRFQIMYVITKNWSQIILNQLELIYNARFQYQEVIKSAVDTKQFRYNIQQLKLTNEQLEIRIQIKDLIFKLYEYALNSEK